MPACGARARWRRSATASPCSPPTARAVTQARTRWRAWRERGEAWGADHTHQWGNGFASQAVQAERERRCRTRGARVGATASSVKKKSRAPMQGAAARDAPEHGNLRTGGERTNERTGDTI